MNITTTGTALVVASLCLSLGITGCTRSLPSISHAHVGHALTTWRDTPDQQGLFVVAERELASAIEEIDKARRPGVTSATRSRHLAAALHALDPDQQEAGAGLGYGALRALQGANDHMVFAAQSEDASNNLVQLVAKTSDAIPHVLGRLNQAIDLIRQAEQSPGDRRNLSLGQLSSLLRQVRDGVDLDRNGVIGNAHEEYGLQQVRSDISTALRREDPAYRPIGKQYLLGLVRLPDGSWAYRFDQSGGRVDRGGYGYSY